MGHSLDLEGEARANRDIAARARQMARRVLLMEDRLRIERFASELVNRASELEPEVASFDATTFLGARQVWGEVHGCQSTYADRAN